MKKFEPSKKESPQVPQKKNSGRHQPVVRAVHRAASTDEASGFEQAVDRLMKELIHQVRAERRQAS
ncbi:MAG: hypothetical protein AAF797_08415 [Planctomycetota bacterium]